MAGNIRHLLYRSGRYYARLSVPANLRSSIGKRELLEALGADKRTAERNLSGVIAQMQIKIDAAKELVAEPKHSKPRTGQILNEQQIARAFYESELALDGGNRDAGNIHVRATNLFINHSSKKWIEGLNSIVAGRANDNTIEVMLGPIFDQLAERGQFKTEIGSPEWRKLARVLAGVQTEIIERQAERDQGDLTGKPKHPLLTAPEALATEALAKRILGPESLKSLSELLPAFLKERDISVGSQHEHGVSVRMFEEHLGEAKPLYKITRRDVIDYKAALLGLPSNYTKRFPDMTLPQATVANNARTTPHPVLAPRTVNDKWLSALRAFLNWCVQNDLIPDNPSAGIKASFQADKGKPPRVNFEPSDLAKIFSAPLFSNPSAWGERQWAYLLSLYCGARPTELAQVKLNSIRHERDILVLRVQEETKNGTSQRAIPIHSELVRLGFETYVAGLRKKGVTHLFAEWYADGMNSQRQAEAKSKLSGKPMSLKHHFPKFIPKQFNDTYRKKIGLTDARKVFYSFRHTFKTGLAQAGVSKDIRDNLTGHSDSSAGSVYVHDVSLAAMHDAIGKLRFDGVTL